MLFCLSEHVFECVREQVRGNGANSENKSDVVAVWVCFMQIPTCYEPGQVTNWSGTRKLGG